MTNINSNKKKEVDSIVESLIGLPIKNLEERINGLENEIMMRKIIFDTSMISLSNRENRLKESAVRLRYDIQRKFILESEISRIRIRKIDDFISYFHDVSKLKQRLQEAREKLNVEKEKRKLVG